MGFSVSGSAAIVFAGMFIAFGMWHSAAADGFERVSEAQQAQSNDDLEQQNTAIEITSTSYASGAITVEVKNTGSTYLTLNGTDVVVDNEYETGWRSGADVDGDASTWLWHPGETLKFTVSESTQPNRVTVATHHGVSDTEVVN